MQQINKKYIDGELKILKGSPIENATNDQIADIILLIRDCSYDNKLQLTPLINSRLADIHYNIRSQKSKIDFEKKVKKDTEKMISEYASEIGKRSHPNGGTEAQKKASRANGAKGGRPKKNKTE